MSDTPNISKQNISHMVCPCGSNKHHVIYDYDKSLLGVMCGECHKVLAALPMPDPEEINNIPDKPIEDLTIEETVMAVSVGGNIDEEDE